MLYSSIKTFILFSLNKALALLCVRHYLNKPKLICLALFTFVNNFQFNLVVFVFFINNSLVVNLI